MPLVWPKPEELAPVKPPAPVLKSGGVQFNNPQPSGNRLKVVRG